MYSLKLCGNFVTFFFVFYILYNREGAFTRALEQTFITFVSFLFLSFLFLKHKQVSQSRRLATAATWVTLSFVRFTLQRNTWRARAGSFISSRGRFFFLFSLFSSWNFALFFSNYRAGARKSDSAFACAAERNVFYSEHSFPCNVKKKRKIKKHRIVLFYASVSPPNTKNKLREKQKRKKTNTSINVHTQIPELKFFVIHLGANAPSPEKVSWGRPERAIRAKIFQLF